MFLVNFLLLLILVDQDEVDLPHAVVEEQGVRLVIKLYLRAITRLVRKLCCLKLVHLFLHDVVHGAEERLPPVRRHQETLTCTALFNQPRVDHQKWDEPTNISTSALHPSTESDLYQQLTLC